MLLVKNQTLIQNLDITTIMWGYTVRLLISQSVGNKFNFNVTVKKIRVSIIKEKASVTVTSDLKLSLRFLNSSLHVSALYTSLIKAMEKIIFEKYRGGGG